MKAIIIAIALVIALLLWWMSPAYLLPIILSAVLLYCSIDDQKKQKL